VQKNKERPLNMTKTFCQRKGQETELPMNE
jgi:hypothetical protein